ncbi:LytR/AlgR family response regulator transcription factor [Tenacibaculum sp. M341]|uniref:LytR/AlgR family response regulator transcription factor n=1 Tax=Tenacibaculum sp. M341 TaxID=2530339 RepID=UPI0010472437|nr:LytTR family DNA-binding domain-containing protein [Tenacibaculum sp. M341]TCI94859.1 response regulator transcription factor [Tenacibaculum sp. M341]
MIKAIVVDDEAHVRSDVISKIQKNFNDKIVVLKEVNSVATAVEAINELKPNLLFLDVDLGDGTGFNVLSNVDYKSFEVIFITGFDKHALKAIKVGALDYILKPIDEVEFIEAVDKAIAQKNKENHLEKLIEISSEYFNGAKNNRIILKTTDSVYAVYEDDILYCKSDGNYTTFYVKDQEKIVVSKPIKKIEEILSEHIFIRCHQSYIVNKKYVTKYNKQGFLMLDSETKVPVSSRRKDYTLKKIF